MSAINALERNDGKYDNADFRFTTGIDENYLVKWRNGILCKIMERLQETGRDWQKNTIMTFLSRLISKGLIATMIQREMLTPEDYEEIKSFWEGKRNE